MATFEVNKDSIVINGVTRNAGDTINELDAGKQVNALRGSGKIREVGLSKNQAYTDPHIFNGIGRTFETGESVGTGDAVEDTFTLDNTPVVPLTETIYLDGTAQERGTDYTITNSSGEIVFTDPPADTVAITADYSHHIVIS